MLKVTAGYSGTKCPADFVCSTKRNDTMKTKPITAVTLALMFLFVCLLSLPVDLSVSAASGTIYTCKLNRHYQHPVSGVIEDSGGKASFATGQGMVEGCTSDFAVMEESDSGNYYLTIRMSLMDFTSGHSFMVQNRGDTEWQETAAGITGTGSDTNGTTNDICIQVPSENAIVRGTMYVEPMGRSVIWYMYASDFTEGNTTDMNTLMVTSPSVKTTSESSQEPVESSAESSAQSTVESSVEESSQPAESSVEESKIQKSTAQESKPEVNHYKLRDIHRDELNVQECMLDILTTVKKAKKVRFEDIFSDTPTKEEVVTYFMALLELLRLGEMHAVQNQVGGEIYLISGRKPEEEIPVGSDDDEQNPRRKGRRRRGAAGRKSEGQD